MTIKHLMQRWQDDVLRHQVVKTAHDNYKTIADYHIVPTLGRKRVVEAHSSRRRRIGLGQAGRGLLGEHGAAHSGRALPSPRPSCSQGGGGEKCGDDDTGPEGDPA